MVCYLRLSNNIISNQYLDISVLSSGPRCFGFPMTVSKCNVLLIQFQNKTINTVWQWVKIFDVNIYLNLIYAWSSKFHRDYKHGFVECTDCVLNDRSECSRCPTLGPGAVARGSTQYNDHPGMCLPTGCHFRLKVPGQDISISFHFISFKKIATYKSIIFKPLIYNSTY